MDATYTVTAKIRVNSVGVGGRIQPLVLDQASGNTLIAGTNLTAVTAGYQTQTFTFVATGSQSALHFQTFNSSIDADVDDVTVMGQGSTPAPTPTATPVAINNLLTNGTFETGDVSAWSGYAVVVQASAAYAGGYGAHIASDGLMYQDVATTVGQTYYVSARVRINQSISGSGSVVLRANTDGWGWLNEQSADQHERVDARLSFSFVAQTATSRLMWRTQDGTFDTDLDNMIVSDVPIGGAGMAQVHRSARLRTAAVAGARAAIAAAAVTPPTLPATARETSYLFPRRPTHRHAPKGERRERRNVATRRPSWQRVHHHGCRRHEDQRVALQTLRRGAHHLGQHAHRPALPGPTVRRHHRRFWRTVLLAHPGPAPLAGFHCAQTG